MQHCNATTVAHGDTHTCDARGRDHVDSPNVSRRMHHDSVTGFRWSSRLGDVDPLADFVHLTERPATEEH